MGDRILEGKPVVSATEYIRYSPMHPKGKPVFSRCRDCFRPNSQRVSEGAPAVSARTQALQGLASLGFNSPLSILEQFQPWGNGFCGTTMEGLGGESMGYVPAGIFQKELGCWQ